VSGAEQACKVLLVDDEADFVGTVAKRLRLRGLDVEGVHSGEAALEAIAARPPDVVILDVRLPGIDGVEALRAIKAAAPLVEVIMLTGHASVEVAIEGMEFGAFDYLMKPARLDALLYKIQDAFKNKTLQEAKIKSLEG
jgi:DNA-binding NtrC family response regulator